MDDWKMQQGNLGPDADDYNDPDMAMYVLPLQLYLWVELIMKQNREIELIHPYLIAPFIKR